MQLLKTIKGLIQYADHRCAYCGKPITDKHYVESYVRFIKFHDACFEKFQKEEIGIIEEFEKKKF